MGRCPTEVATIQTRVLRTSPHHSQTILACGHLRLVFFQTCNIALTNATLQIYCDVKNPDILSFKIMAKQTRWHGIIPAFERLRQYESHFKRESSLLQSGYKQSEKTIMGPTVHLNTVQSSSGLIQISKSNFWNTHTHARMRASTHTNTHTSKV